MKKGGNAVSCPQVPVPAIMVWIFVWKYIFEPFIHMLQHFVLQLSRSTNFLILILKVAIDATGPRVLNFFSLVLYCLTVISPCTGILSCLGSGSGYRAC